MKLAVIGKIKKNREILRSLIRKQGYIVSDNNPDYVIALGGDGSLLISECIYPSVPKLHIVHRTSLTANDKKRIILILKRLANKDFKIKSHPKLEAKVKRDNRIIKRYAVNDISVRNEEPWHALRFNIRIDNKNHGNFIGDGIVVSTPFGSTGYFYSITHKRFSRGIGLAFNNPTSKIRPIIIKNQKIRLTVIRNKAVISSDNNMHTIIIKEKDSVTINKSNKRFNLIQL